jgi:competence protein ComEC
MRARADLCAAAVGWLLATMLVHQLPALPGPRWAAAALLVALLALRAPPTARFALVGALLGGAWTVVQAASRLEERLPPSLLGRDFPLTGWIDTFPTRGEGRSTFSLTADEPRPAGVPPRLRLSWYDPPAELAPGSAVRVVARLRPPRGSRNPGGFDYERWLLVERIGATGYVRSGAVSSTAANGIGPAWQRYRARLAERIEAALPEPDAAALVMALAIGERHLFSEQHWRDFRRTGTSHLVAVSGMHVALLGLVVFALTRTLWLRLPMPVAIYDLEAAAAASAAATCYYAAVTGFALPAQRSLLMILAALVFVVSRRSIASRHALAVALLLVLLFDPFAPLTAAFWLSFGAVAALLLLTAPRTVGRERWWRRLRALAGLQWTIGWVLLPFTAAFFAEISLIGPLANLAAIPLFNFVLVPLAVLATVLLSFEVLASLGEALLQMVLGPLAAVTVALLHGAAQWRLAAVSLPAPSLAAVLVACAGAAVALAAPPMRGRRLAWFALLPLGAPREAPLPHGVARLTVLDVGHGLAVGVETRNHRLLFDAGPAFPGGFDAGAAIVVPALRARAHRDLDLLIVSHADNDHSGGATAVLDAFPAAARLHGPDVHLHGATCERGMRWVWDGVELSVLHPPADFTAERSACSRRRRICVRMSSWFRITAARRRPPRSS